MGDENEDEEEGDRSSNLSGTSASRASLATRARLELADHATSTGSQPNSESKPISIAPFKPNSQELAAVLNLLRNLNTYLFFESKGNELELPTSLNLKLKILHISIFQSTNNMPIFISTPTYQLVIFS